MSNFDIDEEIDKAVEKFSEQLRARLKKAVVRSEKQILKQYIASQKDGGSHATQKPSKNNKHKDEHKESRVDVEHHNTNAKEPKTAKKKLVLKRETDYVSISKGSSYASDS